MTTTGHLCPLFLAAQQQQQQPQQQPPSQSNIASQEAHKDNQAAAAATTKTDDKETRDDDDISIPTWDDVNGTIHLMFHDEDDEDDDDDEEGGTHGTGATGRRKKKQEWLFDDSSCSGSEVDDAQQGRRTVGLPEQSSEEEDDDILGARTMRRIRVSPPLFAKRQSAHAFSEIFSDGSVEPTEETTDDDDDDEEEEDSLPAGDDSNAENRSSRSAGKFLSLARRTNSSNCSNAEGIRFSLPKKLLQKSTNLPADTCTAPESSLKALVNHHTDDEQVDGSCVLDHAAVQNKGQGEVWIRADLLEAEQLPHILDTICGLPQTQSLVLEEVHQGSVVEALLIFFLQSSTGQSNSKGLRSLSYRGTWISPSLVEHLALSECRLEELELGISLYRTGRDSQPGRPGRRQPLPRRNIARQLQRLDDLEEALAANTSLRALSFLPCCHLKVTEGLLWAATCHQNLQRLEAVVPMCTPQNTVDVHESSLLIFEGLKEMIQQCPSLRDLALYVDPALCRLRKRSHELLQATQWDHLAQALSSNHARLTKLKLEFACELNKNDSHIPRDMTLNIMRGITNNTSLRFLELVHVPLKTSIDFWHGVQMRATDFAQITLRACPEVLSFCMCAKDPEVAQPGWLRVHSLVLDQASLADDLYGLQVLAHSGIKEVVVVDTLARSDVDQFTELLEGCRLESLAMGHDGPKLLRDFRSQTLRSLELHGGQFPVSSDAVVALLEACPALVNLRLSHVRTSGDWTVVHQRMASHALETLEIVQ